MSLSFSSSALVVLKKRYLKKDKNGRVIESPEKMLQRVADSVARADKDFDGTADIKALAAQFYDLMSKGWFIPNSPTLMNAGRRLGQLSACFVLPVEDSIESIFDSLKHTAMIHKSGGGTGFSFSRVRPANDKVLSTAGVSSGPISFMAVFDAATETVKQGGTRRGANMAILRVDHPDIEEFIACKDDPGFLQNFNISVGLTQEFMEALEKGGDYELVNPRTRNSVKTLNAPKIFDMIVNSAWQSGEPGIIFLDRINEANPTPALGEIEATNPCGEQPLLPYESCNLGSINLGKMAEGGTLDKNRLKAVIRTAVHFLDNVVEINKYPLKEIKEQTLATRKVGLGVMGFADLLIKLGVPYDSEEAVALAHDIMSLISEESKKASAQLGEARGNFPAYAGSIYDRPETPYMRNATTTTLAPTGSISIIANASSGIEPIFAVAYTRRVLDGEKLHEFHPLFEEMAKEQGFFTEDLAKNIALEGSIQEMTNIPKEVRRLFKTSHDISPDWHVRIQAAFQKYTDNAVSKTVNFPHTATREDVEKVFKLARETGCKGVTIYRDGSRDHQVLSVASRSEGPRLTGELAPRARPIRTHGVTERIQTGCGRLYVTVNSDDQGMAEVFAQMGKTGGCASSQTEAAGRLISLALRSGVKPEEIIKQIKGIRCPSPAWQNGKMVLSCPDAIGQVLSHCTGAGEETEKAVGQCPDCGESLAHESGCLVCHSCGFSKCS
ncbi:ribonucleoside-diphosphate reductase class II [Desulfatibacillum alkenivorans DSM 16219]|jgi:ribonucleoside-diphosphate reductase alpha chain|uniref:Vitamin B12-dependent ribonucleotide reductase n=1 Tax=Desulfatibacillum alkenivorans DSM 16219 TaxID=1121393 RepID=A0A1M6HU80_9BACT|nr:vitamin B12-dependent ribonucleotide reductase [Desulfatibacillum alkenivorans]SHJ25733.1 ribonucleoside-diphosphate reductase class II [Desulfatibacillum alkenivorans DSM 16219]